MDEPVDTTKLREFYTRMECLGVVALIEFLESPEAEGLSCIGSNTIGLGQIMKEIFLSEEDMLASAWFRTKSLHIGSMDGSATPLQWLEKLSHTFERISPEARKNFDGICGEFARIENLEPVGSVTMSTAKGTFRLPPSEFKRRRHLSDAELEKYRIPPEDMFKEEGEGAIRH